MHYFSIAIRKGFPLPSYTLTCLRSFTGSARRLYDGSAAAWPGGFSTAAAWINARLSVLTFEIKRQTSYTHTQIYTGWYFYHKPTLYYFERYLTNSISVSFNRNRTKWSYFLRRFQNFTPTFDFQTINHIYLFLIQKRNSFLINLRIPILIIKFNTFWVMIV